MGYYYDEKAAQRPIDWIEAYCTYPDGEKAGQLIVLEEFHKDILRNAFGWRRKDNDARKYQMVYVEIPRGNAKSTIATCIGLYMLIGEGEKACEVYCCAGSAKQATKVFKPAKMMVSQNEDLDSLLRVYDKSIVDQETYSTMEAISADAPRQHGHKPNCILFDELHVQPNAELYDAMRTGMTKKRQPIMFMFTTAGLTGTFAEEIHNYAISVREGVIKDESWLVYIYAASLDDDPFCESTWIKANPGWNFINHEAFRQVANEAKNKPLFLNRFKRLHLNIWTGSVSAFIPIEVWDKCNMGHKKIAESRKGYFGLDYGSKRDLSSLAEFYPPEEEDGVFDLLIWFWCPDDTIRDREVNENVNFPSWAEEGHISAVPGNLVDLPVLREFIEDRWSKHDIVRMGYDRNRLEQLVAEMQRDGYDLDPVPQTANALNEPMQMLLDLCMAGRLNHRGHPVLRWQIGHLVTYEDTGGQHRPDKRRSRDRIDGVAATINAIYQYLEDTKAPSVAQSALTSGLL